jgi:hypothetical protein
MTAEIAVMNRSAIALAADSAVTMEIQKEQKVWQSEKEQKVWQSATKIFGLSRPHSVGVMIYGSADLMRIPLETLIKMYRDQLGSQPLATLSSYTDDFIKFLEGNRKLFPDEEQTFYFTNVTGDFFAGVREGLDGAIEQEIQEEGSISDDDIRALVAAAIESTYDYVDGLEDLEAAPPRLSQNLTRRFKPIVDAMKQEVFQNLPLTSVASRRLTRLAGLIFCKDLFPVGYAGVVIAGFGEDDTFPSLNSFGTDGMVANHLKRAFDPPSVVSRQLTASIIPFAQHEMAYSFMEGVDRDYQELVEQGIDELLEQHRELILGAVPRTSEATREGVRQAVAPQAEAAIEALRNALKSLRRTYWWWPVVAVVSVLPKEDLAAMAESLVNLTALKRKVSMDAETVGGPIDVAIISKGDGFVWSKRKKYFALDDNPHVLARYFR